MASRRSTVHLRKRPDGKRDRRGHERSEQRGDRQPAGATACLGDERVREVAVRASAPATARPHARAPRGAPRAWHRPSRRSDGAASAARRHRQRFAALPRRRMPRNGSVGDQEARPRHPAAERHEVRAVVDEERGRRGRAPGSPPADAGPLSQRHEAADPCRRERRQDEDSLVRGEQLARCAQARQREPEEALRRSRRSRRDRSSPGSITAFSYESSSGLPNAHAVEDGEGHGARATAARAEVGSEALASARIAASATATIPSGNSTTTARPGKHAGRDVERRAAPPSAGRAGGAQNAAKPSVAARTCAKNSVENGKHERPEPEKDGRRRRRSQARGRPAALRRAAATPAPPAPRPRASTCHVAAPRELEHRLRPAASRAGIVRRRGPRAAGRRTREASRRASPGAFAA